MNKTCPPTTRWRDVAIALRATWAVAASPPMSHYREYMNWYRSHRKETTKENSGPRELLVRLRALATHQARPTETLDHLPWVHSAPPARRSYLAFVSFLDDYEGPYPDEFFPADVVESLKQALTERATRCRGPLALDEQFEAALEVSGDRPFAAGVLLHALTRSIARGRDVRAFGASDWPVRIENAALICPFPRESERGGDAPGDTYHYWANFAVGLQCTYRGRILPRLIAGTFWVAPFAMKWIRSALFGNVLFAGNHDRIDRLGLSHGREIARHLLSTLPSSEESTMEKLWNRIPGMREFWPVYVRHHANASNRLMHDVGGWIALLGSAAAPFTCWWMGLFAFALGYGLAFTGHWLFEKNTPLTFTRPVLAALADIRMFWLARLGRDVSSALDGSASSSF